MNENVTCVQGEKDTTKECVGMVGVLIPDETGTTNCGGTGNGTTA